MLRSLSQQALQRIFYLRLEGLVPEPPIIERMFSSSIPFWVFERFASSQVPHDKVATGREAISSPQWPLHFPRPLTAIRLSPRKSDRKGCFMILLPIQAKLERKYICCKLGYNEKVSEMNTGGGHIFEKNRFGTIGNDWDLQFEVKDCSSYNSCDTKSTKVVIQLNYVKQKVWFERTLEQYWNRAVNRWPISLFDRAGLAGSELNTSHSIIVLILRLWFST